MRKYNIIIGADIVPTSFNETSFCLGDVDGIIDKEIQKILGNADYIITNLEAPLCDKGKTITKNGPALKMKTSCIEGLKKINPYFYTLANNHIMDYGASGLESTIRVLKQNNINYSGAGSNLKEAQKPFVFNLGEKQMGLICCAEHEFSIASATRCGVNPFDSFETIEQIRQLKKSVNNVMVLYHGGKEHYRYPSPLLQRNFRKMAEAGADVIIAQHTHCIGCGEEYNDSKLIYGQGNFIFDRVQDEFWNTGLLIELVVSDNGIEIELHPIMKMNHFVSLAKEKDKEEILKMYNTRSAQIKDEYHVKELYRQYSKKILKYYEYSFGGRITSNILFKVINKISKDKLLKFIFSKDRCLEILNYIECESHRELLIECLKDRIENENTK